MDVTGEPEGLSPCKSYWYLEDEFVSVGTPHVAECSHFNALEAKWR